MINEVHEYGNDTVGHNVFSLIFIVHVNHLEYDFNAEETKFTTVT